MKYPIVSGGCQCGALRYAISGKLGSTDICHCRMCQKAFGSFGAVLTRVALSDFTWTRGAPATFKSSSKVDRGFCSACGTPLFMFEHGDDFIDLATGTLDEPAQIKKLDHQIGIESKLHWFDHLHNLPKQLTAETRNPGDLPGLASFQHPDHETAHWPPDKT
jgi:hypothetical protein